MKHSLSCLLSLAVVASFFSPAMGEPRSWTSGTGTSISAELESFDGKLVKLRAGARIIELMQTVLTPEQLKKFAETSHPPRHAPAPRPE